MEMVMEARGMQAAIEAITRVNSSSREEVEGDPCSSEKAITPGRLLGCARRQCKIVFADCSNLGLLLVERVKGGLHIPYRAAHPTAGCCPEPNIHSNCDLSPPKTHPT